MPTRPLSRTEMLAAARALRKAGGSVSRAARELGVNRLTLQHRLERARSRGIAATVARMAAASDSGEQARREIKRLEGERDVALNQLRIARGAQKAPPFSGRNRGRNNGPEDFVRVIVPDSHGAHIDRDAAAAFLADLRRLSPRHIVLLGDHLDAGGWLAQHHALGFVAEAEVSFEDDVNAANQFLDDIQKAAPAAEIEYIEGNHERRIERWCITAALTRHRDAKFLLDVMGPEKILRLKERGIKYYRQGERFDGLPVPGVIRRGKVCFTHGNDISENVALKMARRYGTNVVCGHTHRVQSTWIRTVNGGTIGAWSMGCLSKLQPLWQATNPTDWNHAYGIHVVSKGGLFLPLTIPIVEGRSIMPELKLG